MFGERLRREREMRGVSLEEIAERTKIGTRLLKALEDEQFELLPGGIFNKGFVRAYANYLGMDEEQAVAEYLQAAGQAEPDVQLIAQQSDRSDIRYREPVPVGNRGFPFLPVLLLVLVAVAGFGGWKLYQQHMAEQDAARAEQQPSVSTAENPPPVAEVPQNSHPDSSTATMGSQAPSSGAQSSVGTAESKSPVEASGFDVVVRTKGRAWVSLKADGKILVRGILDADQSRTLHANQEIVIWTGNAGMTDVSFQGKAVPLEGGPNEALVMVFTPEGLKSSRQPTSPPAAQTPAPAQPTTEQLPAPQ
jgi:cytoskeleton protein RodZ